MEDNYPVVDEDKNDIVLQEKNNCHTYKHITRIW